MIPIALVGADDQESPLKVLITGFGPFAYHKENPSWLAVRLLHNLILYADSPTSSVTVKDQAILADPTSTSRKRRAIHVSALQVPVSYASVLSIVPGLHQRPPVLPPCDDPFLSITTPPRQGFDLILHVGVAGRGPLRIEKASHKFNYNMKDKDGHLAPVAFVSPTYPVGGMVDPTAAERMARERLNAEKQEKEKLETERLERESPVGKSVSEMPLPIIRGFGEVYREFPDEMQTDIDVEKLIYDIKNAGPEDVFTTCYSSLDAGHYLSDYSYYCSLAEAKRTATRKGRGSKVLFVHCPPVNLPYSSEEVAEALRWIVIWICGTIE